jgi:hypothetical protein
MTRTASLALSIGGCAAALLLTAAQASSPFAQAKGGDWELTGIPGAKSIHQCVGDVFAFARYEHRGKSCSSKLISQSATKAVVEYNCGGAGFGHSELELITPRNLRVSTQGISDGLPFNYVLQARRVGDCPATATSH